MSQHLAPVLFILACLFAAESGHTDSSLMTLQRWGNHSIYLINEGTGGLELKDETAIREIKRESLYLLSFIKEEITQKIPLDLWQVLSDKHIKIFIRSSWAGSQGLFIDANDSEFGKEILGEHFSTEGLTIVLSPDVFISQNYHALFAHEYLHAIHHRLSPGNPGWVREGLGQIFEQEIMGHLNPEIVTLVNSDQSTSLVGNHDLASPSLPLYAHQALFFHYLKRKCFNDRFPWALIQNDIQEWPHVIKESCDQDLDQLALDYEIARFINRAQINAQSELDMRYSLESDFEIATGHTSFDFSKSIKDQKSLPVWTPLYLHPRDPSLKGVLGLKLSDTKILYITKTMGRIEANPVAPKKLEELQGLFIIRTPSLITQ